MGKAQLVSLSFANGAQLKLMNQKGQPIHFHNKQMMMLYFIQTTEVWWLNCGPRINCVLLR